MQQIVALHLVLAVDDQLDQFITFIWFAISAYFVFRWAKKTSYGKVAFSTSPTHRHNISAGEMITIVTCFVCHTIFSKEVYINNTTSLNDLNTQMLLLSFCGFIITPLAIGFYMYKIKNIKAPLFGFSLKQPSKLLIYILTMFLISTGFTIFILFATITISKLLGYEHIEVHDTLIRLKEANGYIYKCVLIMPAVLLAPISEELMFRGCLQTLFIKAIHGFSNAAATLKQSEQLPISDNAKWLSITITSVMFALAHNNTQHYLALFSFSIFMGYCYEKKRNLLIPIGIHCCFNTFSIIMTLLQAS